MTDARHGKIDSVGECEDDGAEARRAKDAVSIHTIVFLRVFCIAIECQAEPPEIFTLATRVKFTAPETFNLLFLIDFLF
jgi:hypothetical protein